MRRILAIVRADFLQEFNSPAALIFFLVLPLVFTASVSAGLSGIMGGAETPSEITVPMAVVFDDEGPLVDIFVEALEANRLEVNAADALPSDGFGLIIPEHFTERVIQGESTTLTLQVDGSDNRSVAVQQAVDAALVQFGTAGAVAVAGTEEMASAGQLVTWVQITLLATSAVLVNERVNGTLQRLVVMPTARATILTGKLAARLLMGLLQMTILLLSGVLLFNVSWGQDFLAVSIVSLAFALAVTGLGLLLATLVKTPAQAGSATTGLAMLLAAMGGAWWPLEVTPTLYQQVVQILPSTWAMRAYTRILAQGAGLQALWLELSVLLGFAVLFFVLGIVRFNRMAVR
ncbi:MAG: ABC transporter permease [Chloroflexi bacterium]|jgi:ABC-2 type transport system permease protein|nr:ABC transporter permease [Chloroflexota bacterium]